MLKHIALVAIMMLGAIGTAHAQTEFLVGTTEELKEIRAVADMVRYENGSPYANPPQGAGIYCLGFFGTWYCSPMEAECFAPPYTTSCGTVSMFGGMIQAPIGHAWGPATGEFTAGLPGSFDFVELDPATITAYEGQTRTINGHEVTVPAGQTFEELPALAQQAIVEFVCAEDAATKCASGVLYCCD